MKINRPFYKACAFENPSRRIALIVAANVRDLEDHEVESACMVLGRGMRDNPNNVRAFAGTSMSRTRALTRMFRPVLRRTAVKGRIKCATWENRIVGVCASVAPNACQLSFHDKLVAAPSIVIGNPPPAVLRVLRWTNTWARRDPRRPHWHLGPVAADAGMQGKGIGSALMKEFCLQMDRSGALAYLETDKRENLDFYRKFGFDVVDNAEINGVPNWFMIREPAPADGDTR